MIRNFTKTTGNLFIIVLYILGKKEKFGESSSQISKLFSKRCMRKYMSQQTTIRLQKCLFNHFS